MSNTSTFITALLIAVLALIIPSSLILYSLLMLLLFMVCRNCLYIGILVMVFIVGCVRYVTVARFNVYIMEAVFAAFLMACIYAMCQGRVKLAIKTPLTTPFAFFILCMFISYFNSGVDVRLFTIWLGLPFVYFLIVNLTKEKKHVYLVLYSLIFAGCVYAIYGLYQHFAGIGASCNMLHPDFVVNERFIRAYSVFGQPNQFAAYLNLLVPLAFVLFIYSKGRKRALLGIACLILVAALTSTVSRTGILSCFFAHVVISAIIFKKKGLIITKRLIAAWSILIFAIVPFILNGTLSRRFQDISVDSIASFMYKDKVIPKEDSNYDIAQRFLGLHQALKIIKAHPLWGIGVGGYRFQSSNYPVKNLQEATYGNFIHNLYLQLWVEYGVFTLIAFLIILVIQFKYCIKLLERSFLVIACFGSFLAYLIHSMFDYPIYRGITLIVGIILAVPFIVESFDYEDFTYIKNTGK